MALSAAGATVAAAGIGVLGDALGSAGSIYANKELQKIDHEFQAGQAMLSRSFTEAENRRNRDWQTNANKIAMDFSRSERLAAQEYNTEMANTAIQRQYADLKAAGLNPILAAQYLGADSPVSNGGNGVSTSPTGISNAATARGSNAHANINFDSIGKFVGEYLQNARRISAKADEYQHDREMQEMRQKHEKSMQRINHNFIKKQRTPDYAKKHTERDYDGYFAPYGGKENFYKNFDRYVNG